MKCNNNHWTQHLLINESPLAICGVCLKHWYSTFFLYKGHKHVLVMVSRAISKIFFVLLCVKSIGIRLIKQKNDCYSSKCILSPSKYAPAETNTYAKELSNHHNIILLIILECRCRFTDYLRNKACIGLLKRNTKFEQIISIQR